MRGYKPGRFSFNVAGGRCEACEGNGSNRLEMDFLADVWVTCPVCQGHRFNRETLQVRFKGKTIADVLEMDVQEALEHFENIPNDRGTAADAARRGARLHQARPALADALRRRGAADQAGPRAGQEEHRPHALSARRADDRPALRRHSACCSRCCTASSTPATRCVVVEHNLDVIKTADWIIDLGPEGGAGGGRIVADGTPEDVAAVHEASYTGQALRAVASASERSRRPAKAQAVAPTLDRVAAGRVPIGHGDQESRRRAGSTTCKDIDVDVPRDKMTVCCGPSGSGKSSLAMDTLYAEGQRRYVESSQRLRPAVRRPDAKAARSSTSTACRRPSPSSRRSLGHTPALDRRHRDRNLRLPADSVRPARQALLPRLRASRSARRPPTKSSTRCCASRRARSCISWRRWRSPSGESYEALWERDPRGGLSCACGSTAKRIELDDAAADRSPPQARWSKWSSIARSWSARRPFADGRHDRDGPALGKGVLHVACPDDDVPEPSGGSEIYSQHFACDRCGRSFEELTPHSFSFNSPLGWCPACEGLGTAARRQSGGPAADPKLSLGEGAVAALARRRAAPLFARMLEALGAADAACRSTCRSSSSSSRSGGLVLHGSGDGWIDVSAAATRRPPATRSQRTAALPLSIQGAFPGAGRGVAAFAPACAASCEHWSTKSPARLAAAAGCATTPRPSGSAVGRSTTSAACRWASCSHNSPTGSPTRDRAQDRRRPGPRGAQPAAVPGRRRPRIPDAGPAAPTLSGGEAQRIRLASQIGSGLTGVLYVLDEPTIGLHPRDNRRLLGALGTLARSWATRS